MDLTLSSKHLPFLSSHTDHQMQEGIIRHHFFWFLLQPLLIQQLNRSFMLIIISLGLNIYISISFLPWRLFSLKLTLYLHLKTQRTQSFFALFAFDYTGRHHNSDFLDGFPNFHEIQLSYASFILNDKIQLCQNRERYVSKIFCY